MFRIPFNNILNQITWGKRIRLFWEEKYVYEMVMVKDSYYMIQPYNWGTVIKHVTMLLCHSQVSVVGYDTIKFVYGCEPKLATLQKIGSCAYANTPKTSKQKAVW